MSERQTVTVTIGGEEFTIRTDAGADYARRCAEHLDRSVGQVFSSGAAVEPHRAVILAALSLTDELFKAREETEQLRSRISAAAGRLAADVRTVAGAD
jgi:cell division protein ZapA